MQFEQFTRCSELHSLEFWVTTYLSATFALKARKHRNTTTTFHVLQDMLKLSADQIRDLMFLRKVACTKNHILSSQREAVAAKILEDSPTPVVNVNKLSVSAVQLQQQALDEHDVVQRVKWAIHCGVCLDSVNCLGLSWGCVA